MSRDDADREYEQSSRDRRIVPCDKCDGPNDRADESNYCTVCSAEYQARIARNPEQRPTGVRSWRR